MELGQVYGWRKASHSSPNGGDCIEAGNAGRAVAVRDTKDREGPKLVISPAAWQEFTRKLKTQ